MNCKRDNHINYVVNEEKRTCTAYLEGVRDGMWDMVAKRLEQVGLRANMVQLRSYDGKNFLDAIIDGIPDKITITVRCSPEDEFNPETGCALARARLLRKLYWYRQRVSTDAFHRLDLAREIFCDLSASCAGHIMNYTNEEDAILDSLKKSN